MNISLTKIALVVEYEGTQYCGFQYQDNAPSVQEEIEKALAKLTGEQLRVVAASRTDTGVHASYQVVSFRTGSRIKPQKFIHGLNHYLPPDIAVKESYKVNNDFNVQLDAVSREYQYLIFNSPIRSAFRRLWSYQVYGKLNLELMNQACQNLIGEHDLASFVTAFSKSVIKSTFRLVYQARIEERAGLVIFNITARSFLPHQVRNTVGSLIKVGLDRMSLEEFKSLVEARKPGLAGPTVPAQGLYLIKVNYPRPLGEYDEDL